MGLFVLNPMFWTLGLLALLAPLLAHLLSRNVRETIWFPSLQFLENVAAQQSNVFRLRHWILLVIRCLVIALLASVFLRPVLERSSSIASSNSGGEAPAAIVLLDASASMGYRDAPTSTRFDKAKRAATRLLDDLPEGSPRNLIIAGSRPRAILPEPGTQPFHIMKALKEATVGNARAALPAALAEAVTQAIELQRERGGRVELHLVSDFQRSNWSSVDLATVPQSVDVLFVRVDEEGAPENTWIQDVELEPAVPAMNESVSLRCRLGHAGTEPVDVPVKFELGELELTEMIRIAPGNSASVTFPFVLDQPGTFEATLSIPGDRLEIDNTHVVAVRCADKKGVLMLSDAPDRAGEVPSLLRAALDPFAGNPDVEGASPYSVRLQSTEDLLPLSPQLVQAVVLCATRAMTSSTRKHLGDYLKNGGSVIAFLHTPADAMNLLALEADLTDLTLPVAPGELNRYGDRVRKGEDEEGGRITQANLNHPMLSAFRDSDDLAKVHAPWHFSTRRQTGGTILARYNTGHTALSMTAAGAGTLVIANVSPHPDRSDLARRLLFVPLIHEWLRASLPTDGVSATGPLVGQSATVAIEGGRGKADKPVVVTNPNGERMDIGLIERGGELSVILMDTEQPGFYRVTRGGEPLDSVAVNSDPRESRLETMSAVDLRSRAGGGESMSGTEVDELTKMRKGIPLWPWLLLGVLGLLAVEQALWMLWRRK